MPIPKGNIQNFETLKRAIADGRVALMEVIDSKTGETVDAICALNREGSETGFVPLAVILRENPYERLRPPNPDGGFHESPPARTRKGH